MRITFNLLGVNLANNGGSSTIVASANMLCALGCEIFLVMSEPSQFSWFPVIGPKEIITNGKEYPKADIHIATGAKSARYVLDAPEEAGKKFWYIRAHEKWVMSEEELFKLYRNSDLELIVNSIHLQKFLKRKINRESIVIHPGQELDIFYPTKERNWDKKEWVLGGLYNTKPRKRFEWVSLIYEQLKYSGIPVKLKLFGTYELPKEVECDEYLFQPDVVALREFYNSIDFWIAPTKSEGLHIVPQEAMLCGCVVFGADGALSGMDDYLTRETGIRFSYWMDVVNRIKGIKDRSELKDLSEKGKEKILSLGTRERNMDGFLYYLKLKLSKNNYVVRNKC